MQCEDLAQAEPGLRFDQPVELEEGSLEGSGELSADRRLTGTAEADQRQGALARVQANEFLERDAQHLGELPESQDGDVTFPRFEL